MPIRDYNDSERLVALGANMAWRDTARHRADSTMHIGPHTKAEPYQPSYQLALAGTGHKELPWVTTKLLEAPEDEEENELTERPDWVRTRQELSKLLEEDPSRHVLPRPLLDVIFSTSQARKDRHEWYPSPLRAKWARLAVARVKILLNEAKLPLAATALAEVFGTMLPSFINKAGTEEERLIGREAWDMLMMLVDPRMFVRAMGEATASLDVSYEGGIFNRIFHWTIPRMPSIGPAELILAERITKAEEALVKFEEGLGSIVLDEAIATRLLPRFPPFGGRIRFVSDVPHEIWNNSWVDPLKRIKHVGLWGFNRSEENALQLLVFKSEQTLEFFFEDARSLGLFPGSVDRDVEWWVHRGYGKSRKRCDSVCKTFKYGMCPTTNKTPLTTAEQDRYVETMRELARKSRANQIQKQQRELDSLRYEHKRLVQQYLRDFGGK